jgi:hypothetical protein
VAYCKENVFLHIKGASYRSLNSKPDAKG